jgi:hypothetical protein
MRAWVGRRLQVGDDNAVDGLEYDDVSGRGERDQRKGVGDPIGRDIPEQAVDSRRGAGRDHLNAGNPVIVSGPAATAVVVSASPSMASEVDRRGRSGRRAHM